MTRREIFDIKTDQGYSAHIPDLDYVIDDSSRFKDAFVSEVIFPSDCEQGISIPVTNMHVIGLRNQGVIKKFEGNYSNQGWQTFHDDKQPLMSMGVAGDNALGLRWNSKDVEGEVSNIGLYFTSKTLIKVAEEALGVNGALVELNSKKVMHDPLIRSLLHAMNDRSKSDFCSLYNEQAQQMLFVQLLAKHCTFTKKIKNYKKGLSEGHLNKVIEYIHAYYNRIVTVDELAALCNMSNYHFSRLFKISTGQSPRQYILSTRVNEAKKLLVNTALTIEEIGFLVGYSNSNNFSRMFSRNVGVSPLFFRVSS